MASTKDQSLEFYKYLCKKIGTKAIVKARRLWYTVRDIGCAIKDETVISSGSKAEGLDFNSSDEDVMVVQNDVTVYETEADALENIRSENKTVLIMDTENTKPCFTQLRLLKNKPNDVTTYIDFERVGVNYMLSSERFKLRHLVDMSVSKIHGPCVTSSNDCVDLAYCIKCDKWISDAQPWQVRSRSS